MGVSHQILDQLCEANSIESNRNEHHLGCHLTWYCRLERIHMEQYTICRGEI